MRRVLVLCGLVVWTSPAAAQVRVFQQVNGQQIIFQQGLVPVMNGLPARRATASLSPYLVARDAPRHSFSHGGGATALVFFPGGKLLATTSDTGPFLGAGPTGSTRVWSLDTGQELRHFGDGGTALAISADGHTLITAGPRRLVSLWDPATGMLRRRLSAERDIRHLALSPDGKTLAVAGPDVPFHLLDLATGRELARLGHRDGGANAGDVLRRLGIGKAPAARAIAVRGEEVLALAFAPDGKTLASEARDGTISIWDVATGRERCRLIPPGMEAIEPRLRADRGAVAFSPDGKMMASAGDELAVRLWDVADGREQRRLTGLEGRVHALAFSGDGRTLATGGAGHAVRLWEVATGFARRQFPSHTGDIAAVAFCGDGKSLATAAADTWVRVWDLTTGPRPAPPAVATPEMEKLWGDLASADAARAYSSLWRLADAGGQAIPFLRRHLRPPGAAPPAGPQQLARLIHQLDDPSFQVRERATDEIAEIGRTAEPALQDVLARRHSAEQNLRVRVLLEDIRAPQLPPDRLRPLRAVEVLEHVGTPDARRLVRELAAGPADALLTREARAALDRLSHPTATR